MDTVALRDSWREGIVAAGDDTPLYFYSHLFSRVAELRSMFAIQI
jgi:hypothetical protein